MKKVKILPCLICCLIIVILSCKKKSDPDLSAPVPSIQSTGYQLLEVSDSVGNVLSTVEYNSNGQPLKILAKGKLSTEVQYLSGKIIEKEFDSNSALQCERTLEIGANGLAKREIDVYTQSNPLNVDTIWYTYDNLGYRLFEVHLSNDPYSPSRDTFYYNWSNGDMISFSFSTRISSFNYCTQENKTYFAPGSGLDLSAFIGLGKISKHIVSSTSGNFFVNNAKYEYIFDSMGRVSKSINYQTGFPRTIYQYKYK